MSTLVSISGPKAASTDLEKHRIRSLPVLVLSPHNRCNCKCVMCDIWRIREGKDITPSDMEQQLSALRELGVRWVVFTGGEPQLNREWTRLAAMIRNEGVRVTMLTAGLLLQSEAQVIAENVDDLIISLDGPRDLHNAIRRVPQAFERLASGVEAVRGIRPDIPVLARCTVQRANHNLLCATVQAAKSLGASSISFLAADVSSGAFNRPEAWPRERQEQVALLPAEVDELHREMERLIRVYEPDLESGFIAENAVKLRKIVTHFRAHLGQASHISPRCNAPWVSAVIDASGEVRPCFFHPAIGNIHAHGLGEVLNSPQALQFRAELDVSANPICQRCVCSLYLPREN